MWHLGIDVAKESFEVVLLDGERTLRGSFDNNTTGFAKLGCWLKKRRKGQEVRACLEPTGRYWEELALFLHEEGIGVSVVNARAIKQFAESQMQRNKTDRADALVIAQYLARVQPGLWSLPSPAVTGDDPPPPGSQSRSHAATEPQGRRRPLRDGAGSSRGPHCLSPGADRGIGAADQRPP